MSELRTQVTPAAIQAWDELSSRTKEPRSAQSGR